MLAFVLLEQGATIFFFWSYLHQLPHHVAHSEFILVPLGPSPIPQNACGLAIFNCCVMLLPGTAFPVFFLWESTPLQLPTITGVS